MAGFFKENFTGNPKFRPRVVMFVLEMMLPQVELEGVSAACDNVIALSVTVRNLVSSVDAFDYCLRALGSTSGL